jgi:hypothetical protein
MSALWLWVAGSSGIPKIDVSEFEKLIPDPQSVSDEYYNSACGIYDLVEGIADGAKSDENWRIADFSINLLENHICHILGLDINRENSQSIVLHPLMAQEMKRQTRDLTLAKAGRKEAFEELRTRSQAEDIFVLESREQTP